MTLISIDEELLIARAVGRLSAPMRLLVDTHAAMNAEIAEALKTAEETAGVLLEEEPVEALADDALDVALAAIEAIEAGVGEAAGLKPVSSQKVVEAADAAFAELMGLPGPVRDRALEMGADWRFAAPGVRRIELMSEGEAKAELLRIEPGHGSPSHSHDGQEFTLVLAGAFADGIGRYAKGDLCAADGDTTHRPIAEPGETCFALAVTDGSLKFTGPLGAVQRLFGG